MCFMPRKSTVSRELVAYEYCRMGALSLTFSKIQGGASEENQCNLPVDDYVLWIGLCGMEPASTNGIQGASRS